MILSPFRATVQDASLQREDKRESECQKTAFLSFHFFVCVKRKTRKSFCTIFNFGKTKFNLLRITQTFVVILFSQVMFG